MTKHPHSRKERRLINEKKQTPAQKARGIRRKLREERKAAELELELQAVRNGAQPIHYS